MKKPCPRCGKINEGSRARWHSECVHDHKMEHWQSYVAAEAWRAKPHHCAHCYIDLDLMQRLIDDFLRRGIPRAASLQKSSMLASQNHRELNALLREYGWNDSYQSIWEANHIVPRKEGGGKLGLDNIEILCVPCHKHVSREQQRRWAAQRRQQASLGL